jgi:uncharacterized protein (TIGR02284 family)
MSVDARVSKDLVETLRDGQEGFAKAAEKLADSDAPEIGATFRGYSEQRRQFADELEKLAQSYGDDVDESGSAVGALHRGWISVKDAVTGSSPEAVLKAAESGESHAVTEYKKALDAGISTGLRDVVARQYRDVVAAHDAVRSLADAHS